MTPTEAALEAAAKLVEESAHLWPDMDILAASIRDLLPPPPTTPASGN